MTNIKKLIGSYWYEKLEINSNTRYVIEDINAVDLLTYNRLDIISKIVYLKFKYENINSDYAEKIYKSHIAAFSEGKYIEPGSKTKVSFNGYVAEFDTLYNSIKNDGFKSNISLIPVANDYSILDGSHRVAISAYLNKRVKIIRFLDIKGTKYDYNFFEKRQLKREYIEFLVLNYAKLKRKDIYVVCLWPMATKNGKINQVEEIISKYSNIFYKKECKFSYDAFRNFLIQIYGHQNWVGDINNNFAGIDNKLNSCYANSNIVFYCIDGGSLQSILKLKEEIRVLYNIDKHSVHITDNYEESEQILNLILNENSLHFLKFGKPLKYHNIFNLIEKYHFDDKNKIFDKSLTLSLYGIESTHPKNIIKSKKDFDCDITYDTTNFFFYRNKKFISPKLGYMLSDYNEKNKFKQILGMKEFEIIKSFKGFINKLMYTLKIYAKRILKR